ncbi:SIS domain-containing protein [Saccharothrix sp. ALI-22-I]|uniref:SIS domain-containing protein n=1 Tax=Saccharothrix sp. ALI-22-I TaxID=1933778 RepID=UPI001EE6D6EC|nr:SIS domain-containing protein [Saccharothrix sp. ALI-22-I]
MDFPSDFGTAMREHLRLIEDRNAAALDTVADRLLDVVRADLLVHTAAAGHSLAAVLETFYRAGGPACVRPLFHPALLPLHGAQASTQLERVPGLAATLIAQAQVQPGDVGVIFSNSGVNAFPVEIAHELKRRGAYVVAFSSRPTWTTPRRDPSPNSENWPTFYWTPTSRPATPWSPPPAEPPRPCPPSAPPTCGTSCWSA